MSDSHPYLANVSEACDGYARRVSTLADEASAMECPELARKLDALAGELAALAARANTITQPISLRETRRDERGIDRGNKGSHDE